MATKTPPREARTGDGRTGESRRGQAPPPVRTLPGPGARAGGPRTGRPVTAPRHTRPQFPPDGPPPAPSTPAPPGEQGQQSQQPKQGQQPKQAKQGQQAKQGEQATPGLGLRRPSSRQQRMPFIVLLVGLLGGALISLLVISTTLAEGAFAITNLQTQNASLVKQEQTLTDEVAEAQNQQVIDSEAAALGMRPDPYLRFLDPVTGKISESKAYTP